MAAVRAVMGGINSVKDGVGANEKVLSIEWHFYDTALLNLTANVQVTILYGDTLAQVNTKIIDAVVAAVQARGHTIARAAVVLFTLVQGT